MHEHQDHLGGVTLSERENEITDLFLQIVQEGFGVTEAARAALSALPDPDPLFVIWLSQGTLSSHTL